MSRTPIPTTPYTVNAVAVFASTRWRFEIYGGQRTLVTVSAGTFPTAEAAISAGIERWPGRSGGSRMKRLIAWVRSFVADAEASQRFTRVDYALDGYVHGDGVCPSPICPWCRTPAEIRSFAESKDRA